MNLRASLIELWTRVFPYEVSKNIFSNGENDQYSKEIEAVLSNSPTGVRSWNMLSTYISGSGLTNDPEMDDFNTLWDVVRSMGRDIGSQGGVWIHRSIMLKDSKLVTAKIKTLNYHKCKIGKKDDNDFDGKVWYGDFSAKIGFFKEAKKNKWFYSFNDSQAVIKEQILNDAKEEGIEDIKQALEHYRGQVMYINTTPHNIYAESPFDCVYNDLDTEYRISLYGNKMFRSGFLGKLMVFYSGLSKEDKLDMLPKIQKWLGAENSDTVFLAEVESTQNIEEAFYVKQMPTQYDDDMSQNTEKRITRNILGAARNIPEKLLFADNSIFGGSGEMVIQLKQLYSEQTEFYRTIIEKNLRRLGYETKIKPLGHQEVTTPEIQEP